MDSSPNKTEADFEYERYIQADMDEEDIVDDDADPVLVGDKYLAADIGLNSPKDVIERDELVESDAYLAAETAGLTLDDTDYTKDEELLEMEEEDQPLEDVPDADDVYPNSIIDPASPPVDVMPGTDVLNGSQENSSLI